MHQKKEILFSNNARRSELLTKLSSWILSRNEFFEISEVQIGRHFFNIFGKIGKMTLPKRQKYYENYSNFLAIFGPIWTQFRSKQLKIWPGSHFCSV